MKTDAHPARGTAAALEAELEQIRGQIHQVHTVPVVGARAFGVPELDARLWALGRQWLQEIKPREAAAPGPGDGGPDVYLATEVHLHGGHTLLMGDFVRTLGHERLPHLILTGLHGTVSGGLSAEVQERTGIAAGRTHLLATGTLGTRALELLRLLDRLRPRRLFLFHHPDDPLPCLAAHPTLAAQTVLVHHADSMPCFGLHLPGVRVIEVNPVAAAMSRLLGIEPGLLPLTCLDPGPRPAGFLKCGTLVTATCGSQSKYVSPHAYDYPTTVRVILEATGGQHVHIGGLDGPMQSRIFQALERGGVAPDRFVHVPWAPSLTAALWEHGCDVYFSSFPIDGARVNVEVMAAGVPHLRFATRSEASLEPFELSLNGGMVWRTWEELAAVLHRAADAGFLQEKSDLLRRSYERLHHPVRFAESLRDILNGGAGFVDPVGDAREGRLQGTLVRALASSAMKLDGSLKQQRARVDTLVSQQKSLRDEVRRLEKELKTRRSRPGLLVRWREWWGRQPHREQDSPS